jgi:hypothetical protein
MSELSPSPLEVSPDRVASLVYIMKGRSSPFFRLGVLGLDAGMLTLHTGTGTLLFAVPVTSVQARRRRMLGSRAYFRIHAADRWWYLLAHVPTAYQRRASHELVARYQARELVPRPAGMDEASYARLTHNPQSHQLMWAIYWLAVLP